jgi:signal peptidase I
MKKIRRPLRYFIVTFVVLCFLGTFRSFLVDGPSDAPSLQRNDLVLINKAAYDFAVPFTRYKLFSYSNPGRGDMVICRIPQYDSKHLFLKRVIGLPGDKIELRANKLLINDTVLDQILVDKQKMGLPDIYEMGEIVAHEYGMGLNHLIAFDKHRSQYSSFGPVIVEPGHYFILGDNRDNSLDSREFGLIAREDVCGKYMMTLRNSN